MLAQMTASAQVRITHEFKGWALTTLTQLEREMGSTGFLITYMAAGIFGNVLGGNFALVGAPSVGASGAIFGCIAVSVFTYLPWTLSSADLN
jgi:membrane associated rhomboid family serine protease